MRIQQLLNTQQSQLSSAEAIAIGLPIDALVHVKKLVGLSDEQMAQILGMSRRTLSRRLQQGKINQIEKTKN